MASSKVGEASLASTKTEQAPALQETATAPVSRGRDGRYKFKSYDARRFTKDIPRSTTVTITQSQLNQSPKRA